MDTGQLNIPDGGYLTPDGLDHWLYIPGTQTWCKYLKWSQIPADPVLDIGQLEGVVLSDYLTQEGLLTFQGSTTILLTSDIPEALAIEILATAVINGAPHRWGNPPDEYGSPRQSTDEKYLGVGQYFGNYPPVADGSWGMVGVVDGVTNRGVECVWFERLE